MTIRRPLGFSALVSTLALAGVTLWAPAAWAWTAYLKVSVGGVVIPGTSVVKGFEGQIEVSAAGQDNVLPGVDDPNDSILGITAGKPSIGPLTVVKRLDGATPRLIKALFSRQTVALELTFVRISSTGAGVPAFRIAMDQAYVTGANILGDDAADPVAERVSFHQINEITYTSFDAKGARPGLLRGGSLGL
jgi:type VI secretion system Hcp family effector